MKLIVGIVHLIDTEHGFQTTLVKSLVVGNQWKSFNLWLYLPPYLGEYWSILCVSGTKTMYLAAPIVVILRFGLYEGVEPIHNLTATNNH